MITAPTNWDTLWNDPDSELYVRITVWLTNNGTNSIKAIYTNSKLKSCSIKGALFSDFSIGNACSACLSFTLVDAIGDLYQLKKEQKVTLECRLQKDSTITPYINQGTYYIDSINQNSSDSINIIAYDELYSVQNAVSQQTADMTFSAYLDKVTSMYDLTFDYSELINQTYRTAGGTSRTDLIGNFTIPAAAANESVRDVLSTVAAFLGGNFALSKSNKLVLYKLENSPGIVTSKTGILSTAATLTYNKLPRLLTSVILVQDNTEHQEFSGWNFRVLINKAFTISDTPIVQTSSYSTTIGTLLANMYDANFFQARTRNIYASDVRANGVLIDPLFELNDVICFKIDDDNYYKFPIADYSLSLIGGCWGEVCYPVTDSAIEFSFMGEWDSSWHHSWHAATNLPEQTPTIRITSKNRFVLEQIGSFSYNITLVYVPDSMRSITVTVTYRDDANELKTLNLTGYVGERYYPLTKTTSYLGIVSDIEFYTTSLPDDAIGKRCESSTLTIHGSNVSSTSGITVDFLTSS